jgi:precorrin-8X/cobalt-precorrin-8 methylmutase
VTEPAAHPIEAESYAILAGRVDLSRWPAGAREVVARMIHATADESFGTTARIGVQSVDAAVEALRSGAPVVCDSSMVAAGATAAARLTTVHCYLEQVPVPPAGSTRAAAAISLASAAHPEGAVWVIGNAPTALEALLDLCLVGRVRPAAVLGLPVGYVGAAEAKTALWNSALRDVTITNHGPRGGSAVAAAAINALARLASMSMSRGTSGGASPAGSGGASPAGSGGASSAPPAGSSPAPAPATSPRPPSARSRGSPPAPSCAQ